MQPAPVVSFQCVVAKYIYFVWNSYFKALIITTVCNTTIEESACKSAKIYKDLEFHQNSFLHLNSFLSIIFLISSANAQGHPGIVLSSDISKNSKNQLNFQKILRWNSQVRLQINQGVPCRVRYYGNRGLDLNKKHRNPPCFQCDKHHFSLVSLKQISLTHYQTWIRNNIFIWKTS